MQIRRANSRDAPALARLAADSAAEEGAASALDAERLRMHAFGANALIEAWVAEPTRHGPLAGMALISKGFDVRRAIAHVVLCELYVAPEARRAGLARRLMSAVAQRARELGARELAITTGVENESAQRFFAAIGARRREAAVFVMSADGLEWLAVEGQ